MTVEQWVRDRLASEVVHLDVAASGRVSDGVLTAEVAHLRAEAEGGYVAEERNDAIASGRQVLGGLVGLGADDVAFAESGGVAFATLIAAWPLAPGARIGIVRSEYGANAAVLQRLAAEREWVLVELPADPLGRITSVPGDLDLVTFPQVPSQRGILQPVEVALASGVPVVLDVAQALGQTPVPTGCAAYIGTSRKWLCGPRGVGFAVVDPTWERLLTSPPTLAPTVHSGVRRFESPEAHIAGRVGLAVAAQEWTPDLMPVVHARAMQLRTQLAGLPGWSVLEPVDEPTAITTIGGGDASTLRAALLERGFLTSVVPTSRAADMDRPVLRMSTAAWVTPEDIDALAAALGSAA